MYLYTFFGGERMLSESEMRMSHCCFTGHRPEKLKRTESEICADLESEIRIAINKGFQVFITGMARGTDIWAGEIVLKLRSEGFPVKLICASPFPGFERSWSDDWKQRYRQLSDAADQVQFVSPAYRPSCFRVRNEWMVDHSALVIAVYNGTRGGTNNTIKYAQKCGVSVSIIDG